MKYEAFFLILTVLTLSIITFASPGYASGDNPFGSGYDHGCDDAGISDPSDRYINQPEKGPTFHTNAFMNGYYDGFDACSGRDGDGSDGNSDVGGSLRVIASLNMGTYGDQYCDSRTFDMRIYVRTELAQEKIVGAFDGQETTFSGLDVPNGSSFRVCAYGNDLDLSGCKTGMEKHQNQSE